MAKNRKSISLRNLFAILTYFLFFILISYSSFLFLSLLVNISRIVARQHMKEELEREV